MQTRILQPGEIEALDKTSFPECCYHKSPHCLRNVLRVCVNWLTAIPLPTICNLQPRLWMHSMQLQAP